MEVWALAPTRAPQIDRQDWQRPCMCEVWNRGLCTYPVDPHVEIRDKVEPSRIRGEP